MSILHYFQQIDARIEIPGFLRAHGLNRRICEVGVRFGYHLRQLLACDPQIAIGVDLWREDGNDAHNDTGMNQRSLDRTYQDAFHQFLDDPRVKPLENQSNNPLVSDPMFDELHQPVTVDVIKETFDVGVQNPVHSLFGDRNV